MRGRSLAFTAIRVGGYFAIAVLISAALVIIASRGAFLQASRASYTVVVPRAPGIHANKTDVLNPAGVAIGVVTAVDELPDGVEIALKLTRDVVVRTDGSAVVRTKTILGEKSVFLDPGTADKTIADGARLATATEAPPAEPHEALDPLVNVGDALPDVGPLMADVETTLTPILEDVEGMAQDVQGIASSVAGTDKPLVAIASRTSALLADLATHSADVSTLATELAALTTDLAILVDSDLEQVGNIIVAVSRLSAAVTGRLGEIDAALAALPGVTVKLEQILEQLLRVLDSEPGAVILADAVNLPTLEHWLEILEAGRE